MRDAVSAGLSVSAMRRGATLGLARIGGIAAQMGVQIAVGALAGASAIGALQLHMAWTSVVGEVLGRGEATRAMRDTAVIARHRAGAPIRRNLRRAFGHIASFSAVLGAVALLLVGAGLGACAAGGACPASSTGPLADFSPGCFLSTDKAILAVSVIAAAPLFAFTRVLAETLKALDKALLAVSVENAAVPLAILGACAALAWLDAAARAVLNALLVAAVFGAGAATLLLLCAVRREVLREVLRDAPPQDGSRRAGRAPIKPRALGEAGPLGPREPLHFWLTGLLNIAFLQLPFLVMPWLVSVDDVGEFAVAHKLVNVITTLLILLAAVYSPRFARAAAAARFDEARRLLRETQYLSLALFTPVWVILLILADPLAWLFSLGERDLLPFLLILGAGQLINAATGLCGVVLNMSGAPQLETRILSICTLLTLVAAVGLGSARGALGIAAASAGGIALRNLASYAMALRHLERSAA